MTRAEGSDGTLLASLLILADIQGVGPGGEELTAYFEEIVEAVQAMRATDTLLPEADEVASS